jgi:hypothetical protein
MLLTLRGLFFLVDMSLPAVHSAVTSPIVAFFLSGPLSLSLVVFLVWWCLRAQGLSSFGATCRVNRCCGSSCRLVQSVPSCWSAYCDSLLFQFENPLLWWLPVSTGLDPVGVDRSVVSFSRRIAAYWYRLLLLRLSTPVMLPVVPDFWFTSLVQFARFSSLFYYGGDSLLLFVVRGDSLLLCCR